MTNIFVTQTSDGWMVREVDEKTREQVSTRVSTRTFRSEREAFKHVMERVASGNARAINTAQYHWWILDVEGVAKWFLNLYGDD